VLSENPDLAPVKTDNDFFTRYMETVKKNTTFDPYDTDKTYLRKGVMYD
jgi:hypothetical protein